MEQIYWLVVLVLEVVVFYRGVIWACKAISESHASVQVGNTAIYATGVAVIMIGIAALACFIAYDLLDFKIPLISKKG